MLSINNFKKNKHYEHSNLKRIAVFFNTFFKKPLETHL